MAQQQQQLPTTAATPPVWKTALFRQCLLSVCLSLSYLCIGLVRGFSAPGLPSMRALNPELLPSADIESWAGSIPPLGAFFGSLVAAPLLHYVGRKRAVLCTSPLWVCSWLLIALATDWPQLVLGRFLSGCGAGITLPSAQIYVAECTDSRTRGVIGSFPALAMSAGILVAYVLGDWMTWLQLAWVCVAVAAALSGALAWLPESPVWLDGCGRGEEARRSREWLRLVPKLMAADAAVTTTTSATKLETTTATTTTSTWRALRTRPIVMPMLVGLTLLLIQQFSGIDAVIFFTVNIFRSSGSSIDGNLATIIVGVVQLASNVLALFVVDRAGRKPLLIVSGCVMSVAMAFMGLAFHLNAHGNTDYGYVPIVSLMVFMVGFSVGFGSIPFLLMGEIFPAQQRGLLSSIAISFNVAAMFTVVKTYHELETLITSAGTFWMYSVFCALGVVFVVFCVPETKGRELDSMALVFRRSFRVLAGKSRTRPATGMAQRTLPAIPEPSGHSNAGFAGVESTKC